MIIDAHLHLLLPDRLNYAWLDRFDVRFALADYAADAARLGIAGVFHVEGDVAPGQAIAEIAAVEHAAAQHDLPPLLGVVSGYRGAADARVFDAPLTCGVRHILIPYPAERIAALASDAELGGALRPDRAFDICVRADQLDAVERLIASASDQCRFVLDHCGNPDIAGNDDQAWRDDLTRIARHANVSVKISGLINRAGPQWRAATIIPYIRTAIDLFGPKRVMWGSDWPVCLLYATLDQWFDLCGDATAIYPADVRSAFFGTNALSAYCRTRPG